MYVDVVGPNVIVTATDYELTHMTGPADKDEILSSLDDAVCKNSDTVIPWKILS